MSRGLFVDASVLNLAVGGDHPQQAASAALVAAAAKESVRLHLSVEAIQELVFHRMRMGSRESALAVGHAALKLGVTHPFDQGVLVKSLELIAISSIRGRDAVHAATALIAGFSQIVTTDSDFTNVPGLRAISPEEALRA